jgi:hypothetical protein
MKNKGRKHKAGRNSEMNGILDSKGYLTHLTRPITSMSPKGMAYSKYEKKKWIKRIRGYFKSQTKELL